MEELAIKFVSNEAELSVKMELQKKELISAKGELNH